MSGRDMKNFIFTHRTDETEKLVRRVKSGLLSSKYKQLDYEQLKALTAQKKVEGIEKLAKVKQLQNVSKQSKEQLLLQQHKLVWHKEFLRLNAARRKLQMELENYIRHNIHDGELLKSAFQDFEDYQSNLWEDFTRFKQSTGDPVWALREDLKYWLHVHHQQLQSTETAVKDDHQRVLATVASVKDQQKKVLEQLRHEQLSLEQDLELGDLPELLAPPEKAVVTGIPPEAFELECPDLDLKGNVLQQFILLDEKYLERLDDLDAEHAADLQSSTGGWGEEAHYLFTVIVDQYPFDMTNRRKHYLDRLKRHFPNKSRSQLVSHEEWWLHYKFYHERRKDLVADWLRDRKELLNRVMVIFSEVMYAYEAAKIQAEENLKQQELCDSLFEKVQDWRVKKLEAMKLKQEIEARQRLKQLELMKLEDEKERKRREEQKAKIFAHQEIQEAEQRKKQEEDLQRLEELKRNLAEQAEYDRQRIKFREDEFAKKEETKRQKLENVKKEEQEKEKRLESLREQVRPHVEADIGRVWNDTESWAARRKAEDFNIQKPLFDVNSFTSTQIMSDPRIKLENKLREAGLHNTNYARHMLAQMKPAHAPRRDMESTVFKQL